MPRVLLCILALNGVCLADDCAAQFAAFQEKYAKVYTSPDEMSYRFKIYCDNLKEMGVTSDGSGDNLGILPGGSAPLLGSSGNPMIARFVKKINEFADLTFEEYQRYFLMREAALYVTRPSRFGAELHPTFQTPSADATKWLKTKKTIGFAGRRLQLDTFGLPRKVDYRGDGVVSPVKNQMACAASFAFASVAALEAAHKKRGGPAPNITLSEQELIDCTWDTDGCSGGRPASAMNYVMAYGLDYASDYPNLGRDGICRRSMFGDYFDDLYTYVRVKDNIVSLLRAIARGPTVVAHHMPKDMRFYGSGVFPGTGCAGATKANHAAVAVGYDLDALVPYIEFKNSWGTTWGDHGFYRIELGPVAASEKGACLIAGSGLNVLPILYSI